MNRLMIIGAPGSGKSTLARVVGARTGLPVIHFDHIFWQPGWVERPKAQQKELALALEQQDMWVCDGNFTTTWPSRAARADRVVWLDLPMPLRFWRVLRRWWRYRGRPRPDSAPGCPERLDREFLVYVLTTWPAFNRKAAALLATLPPGKGLRLSSRRAIADWTAAL
jgi:adenylate kinase family enzyme